MNDWFSQHPLLLAFRERPYKSHPAKAVFLTLFFLIGGELLGGLAAYLTQPLTHLLTQHPSAYTDTLRFGLDELVWPFGGVIALVFLWTVLREKRPLTSLGLTFVRSTRQQSLAQYGFGFALGTLSMVAFLALAVGCGIIAPAHFIWHFDTSTLVSLLIILPCWMVQGASEEILCRGWLFQATSQRHVLTGILISSGVFALLHTFNAGLSPLAIVNLILYGLFAMLITLYTETLWTACGYHAAWNWTQSNLLGFLVSGQSINGKNLLTPGQLSGPEWLTGAKFGAEGSLLVTFILMTLLIYTLWGLKKKVPSWSAKSSCEPSPQKEF